jgi:two-component system LytT family response regulator
MKRIAIIDDEPDARQAIRTLLETYCPEVEICGEADSVENAYLLIRNTQPHGILLDISMEDGSGFDLLDKFPQASFKVIFTTAHDEFALKAFRYHALDYLLKPINPVELAQAVDLVKSGVTEDYQDRINNLLESARSHKLDKITLNSQEGLVFLSIDQIVHLESDGSYTTFYLLNKEKHVIARPIKEFEELLSDHDFFRLHQSFIVHLPFVSKVLREDGGYVLMEGDFKIPIARRRKEEFLDLLKHRFSM